MASATADLNLVLEGLKGLSSAGGSLDRGSRGLWDHEEFGFLGLKITVQTSVWKQGRRPSVGSELHPFPSLLRTGTVRKSRPYR